MNPEEEYNISHFLKDATEITMEIEKRGVLPLLCGGTGFWMETFLDEAPISSVPPDPTLRAELSKTPAEDLFTLLTTLDPNRAKQIDRHNPHRLIRAIEIARAKTAGPHTAEPPTNAANISHTFDICIIALCPPKENLDEKNKGTSRRTLVVRHGRGSADAPRTRHFLGTIRVVRTRVSSHCRISRREALFRRNENASHLRHSSLCEASTDVATKMAPPTSHSPLRRNDRSGNRRSAPLSSWRPQKVKSPEPLFRIMV
ncbi:MAG: hypothetical protein IPL87_04495 [Candidatus Moraniibacteriota bacterium]|nr:MAG: hypothetical protein IPL87_04495 [Candidatus Moranbacteria bacterium]